MAIPMGLTALALLWLLWRLIGFGGFVVGVVGISALLIGLGVMVGGRSRLGLAVIIFAGGVFAIDRLPESPSTGSTAPDLLRSQAFTQTRLEKLRGGGRPVFAYFTADWCVTCKVNEAAAINRSATADAFADAGIVTLKGDFSRADPQIARFLAQHGRSGVPLDLYYAPGKDARILPQILTLQMLTEWAK